MLKRLRRGASDGERQEIVSTRRATHRPSTDCQSLVTPSLFFRDPRVWSNRVLQFDMSDARRRKKDISMPSSDATDAKSTGSVFKPDPTKSSSLSNDRGSLALLLLLYTLQGIPMGLSGSIPLLLAKKGTVAFSFGPFPRRPLIFYL